MRGKDMKKLVLFVSLALFGCAVDSSSMEESTEVLVADAGSNVVGTAPNGLPVVAPKEVPPVDMSLITLDYNKVTNEPFFGYELPEWEGFNLVRTSRETFSARARFNTNFGYAYLTPNPSKKFNILSRTYWRELTPWPGSGSLNWRFEFESGSPCTQNPTGCTYWICLSEGTAWPHCIETHTSVGATLEWDHEPWPAGTWKMWEAWFDVDPGRSPSPTRTNNVWFTFHHTPNW